MHYYKRNIGDYAKKAGRLSMLQHGAYTLLMDACYDRERFPTEAEALEWCWASTDDEICAVKFVLARFFTLCDGLYLQTTIAETLQDYAEKAAINKAIATEREAKRAERTRTVHEPLPEQHEPPPNHKPITTNHKPRTKNQNQTPAPPIGVTIQVWDDWLKIRKSKRLPWTETAWAEIQAEIAKSGLTEDAAIRECCARGWGSFRADWHAKHNGSNAESAYTRQQREKWETLTGRKSSATDITPQFLEITQ